MKILGNFRLFPWEQDLAILIGQLDYSPYGSITP